MISNINKSKTKNTNDLGGLVINSNSHKSFSLVWPSDQLKSYKDLRLDPLDLVSSNYFDFSKGG